MKAEAQTELTSGGTARQNLTARIPIPIGSLAPAKRILLTRRSPAYWRVTFNHSPLNIFGPETIPQLNEIIIALETDEHLKVVVFDSAVEGFFLTHYNFLAKLEDSTSLPPGPTGLQALPDM